MTCSRMTALLVLMFLLGCDGHFRPEDPTGTPVLIEPGSGYVHWASDDLRVSWELEGSPPEKWLVKVEDTTTGEAYYREHINRDARYVDVNSFKLPVEGEVEVSVGAVYVSSDSALETLVTVSEIVTIEEWPNDP